MFDGIYCKKKNSSEVNELLLIDEFNNCIDSGRSSFSRASSCTVDCSNTVDSEKPANMQPWQIGKNVRAIYSKDGEFYEAVIEKLVDNFAIIRFTGYNDTDLVRMETLQPSLGEEAIKEQIKQSELSEVSDEYDGCDGSWREIDWKVGMACRALYEKNDTIYEATVIEIDERERTASLEMFGYGVGFKSKFENMYSSIPEYRAKQEISARKYGMARDSNSSNCDVQLGKNANLENSTMKDEESRVFPNELKSNNAVDKSSNGLSESHLSVPFSSEVILQPKNESEALACLISANYLSGYYAGYYDCIRRPNTAHES